jgi:hypothetical protein
MAGVEKTVCFGQLFTTFILHLTVSTYSQFCSLLRGLAGPELSQLSHRARLHGFALTSQHRRLIHSLGFVKNYSHL